MENNYKVNKGFDMKGKLEFLLEWQKKKKKVYLPNLKVRMEI